MDLSRLVSDDTDEREGRIELDTRADELLPEVDWPNPGEFPWDEYDENVEPLLGC